MFVVRALLAVSFAALFSIIILSAQTSRPEAHDAAIKRGVAFLSKEVPKWHAEHPCYSCHNNGDATRALIAAGMRGYDIGSAVDDTVDFLRVPSKWDQNKAPGGFDDRTLARIQFASALAAAARAGRAPESTLVDAAKVLAADQQGDGSWVLDASKSLASPTTYGSLLATASARATLVASGREPDDFTIVQTDRFFRGVQVENVIDAAAVALGLDVGEDVMAENLRAKCLGIIREGQGPSGGWARSSPRHRKSSTRRSWSSRSASWKPKAASRARSIARKSCAKPSRGTRLPRRAAAARRELAGDDPAGRTGELRPAHLDDGLGVAGAPEVEAGLQTRLREGPVRRGGSSDPPARATST